MLRFLSGILSQLTLLLLHVDHTAAFPQPLTKAEEEECFRQIAAGNEAARQRLITHNLRLVAHMTKKFYSADREQEELISIGTLGLMKAAASFDPDKGARFATYASRCIENEILMHLRSTKKYKQEVSLHEPIGYDKDGNEVALEDILKAPGELTEEVEQRLHRERLREKLQGFTHKDQKPYWH